MLPDVAGLSGIDIGCGEGHNTRLIAARGARLFGVDVAETFIEPARAAERESRLGIEYLLASAVALPFADEALDFVVATMSFMGIPETDEVLAETWRVLKPGGFLQFSISHPCFDTPHRRNLRDEDGATYAIEVGRYFENQNGDIDEWTFEAAPEAVRARYAPFRTPRFTRTLSQWLNLLIGNGFVIEEVQEPRPSASAVAEHATLQDATVVA